MKGQHPRHPQCLEAAGYFTGLVLGQGAATAQFFVDAMSGTAEPQSAKDWWQGVRTGKIATEDQ